MKRVALLLGLVALAAAGTALAGGSGGVTGPAFYVDGELYRTVGTPTDISKTGAPAHSFDTIYALDGQSYNVDHGRPATAATTAVVGWCTRSRTTRAGRRPSLPTMQTASGDLDSNAEVQAALADPGAGGATDAGRRQAVRLPRDRAQGLSGLRGRREFSVSKHRGAFGAPQ